MHLSDSSERREQTESHKTGSRVENRKKSRKNAENGEDYFASSFRNLFLIAILINHLRALLLHLMLCSHGNTLQLETIVLFTMLFAAVSAKSVMTKKSERMENQVDELRNDSWPGSTNYVNDWDHGEVRQITIEKKVPVFVEKIRHVPVVQREYISVPRYITKPIYIERSVPIIVPRLQHYHHHHFSEYHHF